MPRPPLFKRKEIWVPTWWGWLAGLLLAAAAAVVVIFAVPPFLSPTHPLPGARVLVVEGWLPEQGLEKALKVFAEGHYELLVVTGVPIEKGLSTSHYESFANMGVARLKEMGFKGTNIVAVPAPYAEKDRTYRCATVLKDFLKANTAHRKVDLLTLSVHTRRSWLVFELALEPEIQVGIICHPDRDFDLRRWWRTSQSTASRPTKH